MTYLYEELTAPTRLYIKQCPHCGLKYFGKTIKTEIEDYEGSGLYWQNHLKKYGTKPIHLWNSDWYYDTSIVRFASKFSVINKIVESKEWANMKPENGLDGGYIGDNAMPLAIEKRLQTISDPNWKETIGAKTVIKIAETKNDPEWKETVLKTAIKKQKETVNSSSWKDTVGIDKKRKEMATKSDPQWKNTIGVSSNQKRKETMRSEEWKNTIGREAAKKQSKTRNSEEWKEKNSKICEVCGKKVLKHIHTRFHGDKCKGIKNEC